MDLTEPPESFDALLAEFPDAAAVLAESASTPAPAHLKPRTIDAALAARHPGRPADAVVAARPADAFALAVDDLEALLRDLAPGDWDAAALGEWTVLGVVGHLVAVEQYIGALLGLWPMPEEFVDDSDHRAMTQASVAVAESGSPSDAIDRWAELARAIAAHARTLDDAQLEERVIVHGFSYRTRTLLVARTFELWTHSSDMCAALGRPRVDPDAARLRLMCEVAVAALPVGLMLSGGDGGGRVARVVLTGVGGGAWTQPLDVGAVLDGSSDVAPDVALMADAIDFCRVAAQRLSPADLDAVIEGDRALADELLVGVAVFSA